MREGMIYIGSFSLVINRDSPEAEPEVIHRNTITDSCAFKPVVAKFSIPEGKEIDMSRIQSYEEMVHSDENSRELVQVWFKEETSSLLKDIGE